MYEVKHLLFLAYLMGTIFGAVTSALGIVLTRSYRDLRVRVYVAIVALTTLLVAGDGFWIYTGLAPGDLTKAFSVFYLGVDVAAEALTAFLVMLLSNILQGGTSRTSTLCMYGLVAVLYTAGLIIELIADKVFFYQLMDFALVAVIVYGSVNAAVRLPSMESPVVRASLKAFIRFNLIAVPVISVYILLPIIDPLPIIYEPHATIPFLGYFIAWNALNIAYAFRFVLVPIKEQTEAIPSAFLSEFGITEREKEIIELICKGYTTNLVGEKLFISPKTVKNHIYNIFKKTEVENRVQLMNLVVEYRSD